MPPKAEAHRARALKLASDALGEVADHVGFKGSMGRIWALLYLSPDPLAADRIAEATGLSTGAVSMALGDLGAWGIVKRVPGGGTKRLFAAESDMLSIVRGVVRSREQPLLEGVVAKLATAALELEKALALDPEDPETAFVLERVRGLQGLGTIGLTMLQRMSLPWTAEPLLGWMVRRSLGSEGE